MSATAQANPAEAPTASTGSDAPVGGLPATPRDNPARDRVSVTPHHDGLRRALLKCTDAGQANTVPAAAVALIAGSEVVCTGAAGNISSRAGSTSPPSAETTVFMTASISKTVVALLCLQSQELGELSLDTDINEYLAPPTEGSAVRIENPHHRGSNLTARHLLMHCSGLQDDESALLPGRFCTMDAGCGVGLQEYVDKRLREGGEWYSRGLWSSRLPPGVAPYHYSNAGFTLLGLVLEGATGQDLQVLAQDRVFSPLGMTSTAFSLEASRALRGVELAVPHEESGRPFGHYDVAEYPAAGMRSTALDMARYLSALLQPAEGARLLSDESLRELFPGDFRRGLAWWGKDANYGSPSENVWQHGGFMHGVRTHAYLWPQHKAGIVLLTNGPADYQGLYTAAKDALRDLFKIDVTRSHGRRRIRG